MSKRLIDSPLMVVEERGGRAPTQADHSTTNDPADLALFRTLTGAGKFDEAMRLCLERLFTAGAEADRLRWSRDAAIVERLRGRADSSLVILASTYTRAELLKGVPFGKHLHGLARSLQMLRRFDEAFVNYAGASDYLRSEPILLAQSDTNTGRCYTAAGRPENSHTYFNRALEVARASADSHLEGEILESAALALEVEGKTEEAEECAHKSVVLIAATGDRTALDESVRTWLRLKAKLSEGAR